jgi:hypothetical protein
LESGRLTVGIKANQSCHGVLLSEAGSTPEAMTSTGWLSRKC